MESFAQQQIELYLKFRQELDKLCVASILNENWSMSIIQDGQPVGMFLWRDLYDSEIDKVYHYIDCVYVEPKYRKLGLAKKTVLEWYDKYARVDKPIRLHIINNNRIAKCFWESLFGLKVINQNRVETLYEVAGRKDWEKK